MLITALVITAAILAAAVWLTVKQWPDRWALASAIAMVGMTANSWMAQLWMWRAFAWESAYWRDTQELERQLIQLRQQSKSKLQDLNDAASRRGVHLLCDRPLSFAVAQCETGQLPCLSDVGIVPKNPEAVPRYILHSGCDSAEPFDN